MARIPMTAREQLEAARSYGHELYVETRGPWPEHGDPHPKYYLRCTCGYEAAARRSKSSLNGAMVRHMVRAIGEGMDADRVRAATARRAGERPGHGDVTGPAATG